MIGNNKSTFVQINLNDIIKGRGENYAKQILSSFSWPKNKDIESFLKFKTYEFSKQNFFKITLVFWQSADSNEKELVGYYTLNGFVAFGKRAIERDEDNLVGHYLIQMLKRIEQTASLTSMATRKFFDTCPHVYRQRPPT